MAALGTIAGAALQFGGGIQRQTEKLFGVKTEVRRRRCIAPIKENA